jgi:hypothetical protein
MPRQSMRPMSNLALGKGYNSEDMKQLGIPEYYAEQFKGKDGRIVNLPARPFFFNAVRVEYKKMLDRIIKKINTKLK